MDARPGTTTKIIFPSRAGMSVPRGFRSRPSPRNMGPLAFAVGMETYRLVESVPFSRFDTSYDRTVSNIFAEQGVVLDDGPFALGEISFHHSLSFHTAGPNNTTESRMVLATTYFEDGARVVPAPTIDLGRLAQVYARRRCRRADTKAATIQSVSRANAKKSQCLKADWLRDRSVTTWIKRDWLVHFLGCGALRYRFFTFADGHIDGLVFRFCRLLNNQTETPCLNS